jgi:hypothetical protein
MFFIIKIVLLILILLGIYRPGYVVWWSPYPNRAKVLLSFGTLLVVVCILEIFIGN